MGQQKFCFSPTGDLDERRLHDPVATSPETCSLLGDHTGISRHCRFAQGFFHCLSLKVTRVVSSPLSSVRTSHMVCPNCRGLEIVRGKWNHWWSYCLCFRWVQRLKRRAEESPLALNGHESSLGDPAGRSCEDAVKLPFLCSFTSPISGFVPEGESSWLAQSGFVSHPRQR